MARTSEPMASTSPTSPSFQPDSPVIRSRLSAFALAALVAAPAFAQSVDTATNTADAEARRRAFKSPVEVDKKKKAPSVPTLYEGELEDIGPQYLLLENPPHEWFFVSADLQDYYTSNATLGDTATWSDVGVLTAQLGVNAKPVKVGKTGGKIEISGGYRYQNFKYGLFSGRRDHTIEASTLKLSDLDFGTHTLFTQAEWSQGGWFAGTGLRYSAYIQASDDTTSYQEYVPSVHGGYRWTISERDFVTIDADADYRFTRTPKSAAGVSLEGDRNDRYDLGLNLAYAHVFGTRFLVQPSYRVQYSDYTEGDRVAGPTNGRSDVFHTFTLTAAYYHNRYLSVRTYGSAEFRNSNEAVDYSNYNLGVGVMASLTF